ncbi:MAG: signal recognition particle protein [Bacteroidetes bacterium]|nr:signal recognition particle protein [Bacteroidota bacterium]
MFESLTQKLETAFKKLRGQGKITPQNVEDSLREVRRALLDADVNYKVAKQFIEDVQKRAIGQEVLSSFTPGQLIIKIINDEMVKLLGESKMDIASAQTPPTVILVAGLQGSGKTTFSAKLANHLKSKGRFPLLAAADVHRPAAIDQLEVLGKQIEVPVYAERGTGAVKIAKESVNFARKNVRDTVIIDTAGRLHVDEEMMKEVEAVRDAVKPDEILFVVDAMTGQDAVNAARAFYERLNFDGVVLTKLDGDSRGGAALSIRAVVKKPIKFIGIGEKLDALEQFFPDRIASRILGMGDIVTLVEKAQEHFDEEKAVKMEEKLRKSQFTFEDFLDQLREVKKMGPISQVMGMIPGMNKLPANAEIDERGLVRVEAIIQSMTAEERSRPGIINGTRRRRIALGSGTTVQDVNRLLKQFEEMQKMMKKLKKGNMRRMMQGMNFPAN